MILIEAVKVENDTIKNRQNFDYDAFNETTAIKNMRWGDGEVVFTCNAEDLTQSTVLTDDNTENTITHTIPSEAPTASPLLLITVADNTGTTGWGSATLLVSESKTGSTSYYTPDMSDGSNNPMFISYSTPIFASQSLDEVTTDETVTLTMEIDGTPSVFSSIYWSVTVTGTGETLTGDYATVMTFSISSSGGVTVSKESDEDSSSQSSSSSDYSHEQYSPLFGISQSESAVAQSDSSSSSTITVSSSSASMSSSASSSASSTSTASITLSSASTSSSSTSSTPQSTCKACMYYYQPPKSYATLIKMPDTTRTDKKLGSKPKPGKIRKPHKVKSISKNDDKQPSSKKESSLAELKKSFEKEKKVMIEKDLGREDLVGSFKVVTKGKAAQAPMDTTQPKIELQPQSKSNSNSNTVKNIEKRTTAAEGKKQQQQQPQQKQPFVASLPLVKKTDGPSLSISILDAIKSSIHSVLAPFESYILNKRSKTETSSLSDAQQQQVNLVDSVNAKKAENSNKILKGSKDRPLLPYVLYGKGNSWYNTDGIFGTEYEITGDSDATLYYTGTLCNSDDGNNSSPNPSTGCNLWLPGGSYVWRVSGYLDPHRDSVSWEFCGVKGSAMTELKFEMDSVGLCTPLGVTYLIQSSQDSSSDNTLSTQSEGGGQSSESNSLSESEQSSQSSQSTLNYYVEKSVQEDIQVVNFKVVLKVSGIEHITTLSSQEQSLFQKALSQQIEDTTLSYIILEKDVILQSREPIYQLTTGNELASETDAVGDLLTFTILLTTEDFVMEGDSTHLNKLATQIRSGISESISSGSFVQTLATLAGYVNIQTLQSVTAAELVSVEYTRDIIYAKENSSAEKEFFQVLANCVVIVGMTVGTIFGALYAKSLWYQQYYEGDEGRNKKHNRHNNYDGNVESGVPDKVSVSSTGASTSFSVSAATGADNYQPQPPLASEKTFMGKAVTSFSLQMNMKTLFKDEDTASSSATTSNSNAMSKGGIALPSASSSSSPMAVLGKFFVNAEESLAKVMKVSSNDENNNIAATAADTATDTASANMEANVASNGEARCSPEDSTVPHPTDIPYPQNPLGSDSFSARPAVPIQRVLAPSYSATVQEILVQSRDGRSRELAGVAVCFRNKLPLSAPVPFHGRNGIETVIQKRYSAYLEHLQVSSSSMESKDAEVSAMPENLSEYRQICKCNETSVQKTKEFYHNET
eukprot:gene4316-8583_t